MENKKLLEKIKFTPLKVWYINILFAIILGVDIYLMERNSEILSRMTLLEPTTWKLQIVYPIVFLLIIGYYFLEGMGYVKKDGVDMAKSMGDIGNVVSKEHDKKNKKDGNS